METGTHRLGDEQLRRQYEAAGFGGRVGWGERPALLVIDMAGAWTDPSEQLGSDLSHVLEAILRVLEAARGAGVAVFFTTMAYRSPAEIGSVVARKLTNLTALLAGSERVELAAALARRPDEPLIVKPRASAFFGTGLLSMLIAGRVDTVVVTGCSTSGCIRATCEAAFDLNLHVVVPAEAVGDRSPSAHAANLFDIDARYADVMPLEAVLAHLRRQAPGPGDGTGRA
jgi:maleamate amidohydrolase